VAATAILALARANPQTDPEFIKQQLGCKSWQDEIIVGCLRTFGEMKNPALVAVIKKYASDAAPAPKKILAQDADANLTVAARCTFESIQGVGQ
jgi:hypothetical protein